jgi:hypothetical protein
MKIPKFIKQLAKFCGGQGGVFDCIRCKSDGPTASMAASDGRILASVHWQNDDGIALDSLAAAKELSSPPVKAFSHPQGVRFDGEKFWGGVEGTVTIDESGRYPDIERVMHIHDKPEGYVSVRVDAARLGKLCALSHAMNDDPCNGGGLTLFVKDWESCVYAATTGEDGYVARFAIMPLVGDSTAPPVFPPRPGSPTSCAESDNAGPTPAPVPEMMDATQLAAAIAEPDGHDWSVALPPIG